MSLKLTGLCNLCVLLSGGRAASLPSGLFSALKKLSIVGCPSIKKLFEVSLLLYLQNLEDLRLYGCYQIEEIIEQPTRGEYVLDDSSNLSTNNDFMTISLPLLLRHESR